MEPKLVPVKGKRSVESRCLTVRPLVGSASRRDQATELTVCVGAHHDSPGAEEES
jgi:hypothetical protein